ncbi:short-chain fatty acid transporter, partial [bacterium]|nr:short-chain fatty acid transporter [bacterium]
MLQKTGEVLTVWARRNMPDPFLFAILLTFLTLILGLIFTSNSLVAMLGHWQAGFWIFLKFSMQMCLILVTGYALAASPPVRFLVDLLAGLPKNTASAASLVCFVAVAAGFINWGLGIIVGALMAREVGRVGSSRGIPLHYPLLGAAGYMGLAVWHGGLSGSAPLKLAEKGHELQDLAGVIPIQETLFSPMNLIVTIILLFGLPLLFRILSPAPNQKLITIDEVLPKSALEEPQPPIDGNSVPNTLASRLESSMVLSVLTALCGLGILLYHWISSGTFDLTLDRVNFLFLFLGILLHAPPMGYIKAITD